MSHRSRSNKTSQATILAQARTTKDYLDGVINYIRRDSAPGDLVLSDLAAKLYHCEDVSIQSFFDAMYDGQEIFMDPSVLDTVISSRHSLYCLC